MLGRPVPFEDDAVAKDSFVFAAQGYVDAEDAVEYAVELPEVASCEVAWIGVA